MSRVSMDELAERLRINVSLGVSKSLCLESAVAEGHISQGEAAELDRRVS